MVSLERLLNYFLTMRGILESENLMNLENLASVAYNKKVIEIVNNEQVEISCKPSKNNTKAIAISYEVFGYGTPIEIRINPQYKYTTVFIKTGKLLPSFYPFYIDIFGNIGQEKRYNTTNLREVLNDVEKYLREAYKFYLNLRY